MKTKVLPSLKSFEKLVAKGDYAKIRAKAIEIICRWDFLLTGYISLPFAFEENDLIERVRVILKAAKRHPVPLFPLAPSDYCMTYQEWWDRLPDSFRSDLLASNEVEPILPEMADWGNQIIWGQAALGGIPLIYASPESGTRMPGSFWDLADQIGGGRGFEYNEFEKWIIELEKLIYSGKGEVIFANPEIRSKGDLDAEQQIRTIFAGYCLHRADESLKAEIVWEATHLPIPVLCWWLRYWARRVDSGVEADELMPGLPLHTEVKTAGANAIRKAGGFVPVVVHSTDLMDYVAVNHGGQTLLFTMMGGRVLGAPEVTVNKCGGADKVPFKAIARKLQKAGFKVQPVKFGGAK